MKPSSPLKTALVALGAQYVHTNLGVRSIAAFMKKNALADEVCVYEYTINHHYRDVLDGLYRAKADVYLFSCYIWNIGMVLRLTQDLRTLRPDARIGLGGPQVAYHPEDFLLRQPQIDFVQTGEGESTVPALLSCLSRGADLSACPGLTCRHEGNIVSTPPAPFISLDDLGFAYPDLADLPGRILYYESMRGCPFSCSYCTSSIERGVRYRSLDAVFADLSVFLAYRVRQVKFVDRTFNGDKARALKIWTWLAEQDNGITNFHFELAGELLTDEALHFLSGVRPGLFQFEIGVQSTHVQTLQEIDRSWDIAALFAKVRTLLSFGNIHIHLDLIAGLPYEDLERFATSFNEVYACAPQQLQLGFLKVLPGSKMEKMALHYDLRATHEAPYEILQNRWLTYEDLALLHGVDAMVDSYYNTSRFSHLLGHMVPQFSSPFVFYQRLARYFSKVTAHRPVSQMGYYELLIAFWTSEGFPLTESLQWLCKYDLLLHEKPRKLPAFLTVDLTRPRKKDIQRFFMNEENIAAFLPEYAGEPSARIERTAHLEIFPFHPQTGDKTPCVAVFNYYRRDILGRGQVHFLPLDTLCATEA